ncbi:hypothetical protein AB3S75_007257 [Citrus x aurantiifolia]
MGSNFMEIGAVTVNFNGKESPPFVISSRKENNNILIASAFGGSYCDGWMMSTNKDLTLRIQHEED